VSVTELLQIQKLTVQYETRIPAPPALNSFECSISRNQFIVILGESGAGKTTLALAILRLLPRNARVRSGSIIFQGEDLLTAREERMRRIRGAGIALIPQQPVLALNPVLRVVDQVCEVIRAHKKIGRDECRQEAIDLLRSLGLGSDKHAITAYPHELSGGQQQRVVLAQAIALRPNLLIADEPAVSLDPPLRRLFYSHLLAQKAADPFALVLITHSLTDVDAQIDQAWVVYAGAVVERSPVAELIREPLHPYSKLLVRCMPPYGRRADGFNDLPAIPEDGGFEPTSGCSFASRCPKRQPLCTHIAPTEVTISAERSVRCHLYG
jgi:peptide/nickel transport system ATP-binding protein